ncbi:MAG: ATP-binding protein [Acidobacteriaceae bacterium]|nr:ATP-binding protein [Acidobacteriaceae bacterium]
MRTFFFQMFLAFWVSTAVIFFVATTLYPDGRNGSLENVRSFAAQDATELGIYIAREYQRAGCGAIQDAASSYFVVDSAGKPACSATLSSRVSALVQDVRSHHTAKGVHDGKLWVTATPVKLQEGTYVVVHSGFYQPKPHFPPLPPIALPVSLLVTFIFAYALSRPVRSLSKAFKQFAGGDLSARLPVGRRSQNILGGADVRSLMLDFNHMAGRISSLIAAQKMLVRDLSHELRSPLARLRLALEMAREEAAQPSIYSDKMEAEAERVNDLIGQMLTLSLMESTAGITDKEMVDVTDLTESLLPDLEFEATVRGCTVSLIKSPEDHFVEGNTELLRRAIENVARNAIRYTAPASQITVKIFKSGLAGKEAFIHIEISDEGPGIPEESLPLIFGAFYRTDAARGDSTGGFGVGLSIAERAVHLHGGAITAKNRQGRGLSVSIQLPAAQYIEQHDIFYAD